MNAITKRPDTPGRMVAGVALPRASQALLNALHHVENPHPDVGLEPERIPFGAREEAARALVALDHTLRPATADDWQRFLLPLAILPKAPQGREAVIAQVGVFAMALQDIPAGLLTPEAQRRALMRFQWWPTPAGMAEMFADQAKRLRQERQHLHLVATAPERAPFVPPTAAERAHVAAGLAKLRGELASNILAREPTTPKANHISEGHLLAQYDRLAREGNKAAAARAEHLRGRMQAARAMEDAR